MILIRNAFLTHNAKIFSFVCYGCCCDCFLMIKHFKSIICLSMCFLRVKLGSQIFSHLQFYLNYKKNRYEVRFFLKEKRIELVVLTK